jgi:hypothetical protein
MRERAVVVGQVGAGPRTAGCLSLVDGGIEASVEAAVLGDVLADEHALDPHG